MLNQFCFPAGWQSAFPAVDMESVTSVLYYKISGRKSGNICSLIPRKNSVSVWALVGKIEDVKLQQRFLPLSCVFQRRIWTTAIY